MIKTTLHRVSSRVRTTKKKGSREHEVKLDHESELVIELGMELE